MLAYRKGGVPRESLYPIEGTQGSLQIYVQRSFPNDTTPERGFEGCELIPNLPNRLVADLIWPKIYANKGATPKVDFGEV
jgi:hypothetical protein